MLCCCCGDAIQEGNAGSYFHENGRNDHIALPYVEEKVCWCPCNCGQNEDILSNGLCPNCQEGSHEVPDRGACPSLETLICQHESIIEQYRKVLIERVEPLKPEEQYLLLPFLKEEAAKELVKELGGWKLYIDDQIHDPSATDRRPPDGFLGAASTEEAITLVENLGPPVMIDFDHDLGVDTDGNELTVKTFCKWLFENYPNNPPKSWKIHSRNTASGAGEWINSYMDSWVRSLEM